MFRANLLQTAHHLRLVRSSSVPWRLQFKMLLTRQLWTSMNHWPRIATPASQSIANRIANARGGSDILSLLSNREHAKEIQENPEVLQYLCRNMVFTQYVKCEKNNPYNSWLKKDVHLAFKQFKGNRLARVMAPVLKHKHFSDLLSTINKVMPDLSPEQTNELMLLVLYVGVSKYSFLFREMFLKAKIDLPTTSWSGVSDLLRVASIAAPADFKLYSAVLGRIKSDLLGAKICYNHTETVSFLQVIESCVSLSSTRLRELLTEEINRIFADKEFMDKTHNITTWTTAAAKLYLASEIKHQVSIEKRFLRLGQFIGNRRGQFTILQIGQIMEHMSTMYPAPRLSTDNSVPTLFPLRSYMTEESCEELKLKDLLIAAAYCDNNEDLTKRVYNCLLEELASHLTSATEVLNDYGPIFRLQLKWTTRELREMLSAVVRLNLASVLKNDLRKIPIAKEYDETDCLKQLETAQALFSDALTNQQICVLAAFVLANYETVVPPKVFSKLERIIPNCDANCLLILAKGIAAKTLTKELKSAAVVHNVTMNYLHDALKRISMREIRNGQTLLELLDIFHVLLVRAKRYDYWLRLQMGSLLMDVIEKHLKEPVTFAIKGSLVRNILMTDYYSPVIMEFLSSSSLVNEGGTEMQEKMLMSALAVCARFGYKPKCMEEFQGAAIKLYQEANEQNRCDVYSTILKDFRWLDIYPIAEIKSYFTRKVLADIKTFVNSNANEKQNMRLVYDFCTFYVFIKQKFPKQISDIDGMDISLLTKHDKSTRTEQSNVADSEIYRAIVEMLGGKRFVNRDVVKHGNWITFEIALNRDGKPLPVADGGFSLRGDEKRIAIVTVSRGAMARNNIDILLNEHRTKKQFLELIGYDVIFILRNAWQIEAEARKRELYRAIFECKERSVLPVITSTLDDKRGQQAKFVRSKKIQSQN